LGTLVWLSDRRRGKKKRAAKERCVRNRKKGPGVGKNDQRLIREVTKKERSKDDKIPDGASMGDGMAIKREAVLRSLSPSKKNPRRLGDSNQN